MEHLYFLLFTAILVPWSQVSACDPNLQPVVGIPVQMLNQPNYPETTFIAASYVKFVEMFGGRVVPIFANQSDEYYLFLATRLSGVIFPGGESSVNSGIYHDMTKYFYNYSLNLKESQSQNFPILGICLGWSLILFFFCFDGVCQIDPILYEENAAGNGDEDYRGIVFKK